MYTLLCYIRDGCMDTLTRPPGYRTPTLPFSHRSTHTHTHTHSPVTHTHTHTHTHTRHTYPCLIPPMPDTVSADLTLNHIWVVLTLPGKLLLLCHPSPW